MASFAESMAKGMGGPPDDGADDEGPDYKGSLEAAVKDFFESGKAGDYAAAADALQTAHDLCDAGGGDDDGPPSGKGDGHTALLLVPHGGK